MASLVYDNFKFGFGSSGYTGEGILLDPQIFWKYDQNKRYVCDINNGYMRCNHITLLSSENVLVVNGINCMIIPDNYRTIESLLTELNRVLAEAGRFELLESDKRFMKLTINQSYQVELTLSSPLLHIGFEKGIYREGSHNGSAFWSRTGRKEMIYVTLPKLVQSGMNRLTNNVYISSIVGLLVLMDGKDDSDHMFLSSNDFVGVDVVPQDKLAGSLNLFYNTGQLLEFDRNSLLHDDLNFEIWFSMKAV